MTRRRPAPVAALLLAPVTMLALAGCADDADPAAEPTQTVTVTETASASPTPSSSPTATASASATDTLSTAPSDSPSGGFDLSQPPTSYEAALAHVAAAQDASGEEELERFQSADEQYYCSFGERYLRPSCEVLTGVSDPATCGDSMATKVGRIELTKRGWRPFCNTDTIRQPGAPVLDEGTVATWREEAVACVLEAIGLTCVDTAGGRGLFLGPGQYEVF